MLKRKYSNLKIAAMRTRKCPNSILRKKEQSWRYHLPRLQTILQSYSYQNSMVLAPKQTHRSMEQNRDSRNKPGTYDQLIYDKRGKNIQLIKDGLQQVVLGKLDSYM